MAQPFNLGNSFLGKSTIELVNPDIADSANNRTEISVDADGDLLFQRYKDGNPKGNLKFPVHSYGQSEKKNMHTDANGDVRFVDTWTTAQVGAGGGSQPGALPSITGVEYLVIAGGGGGTDSPGGSAGGRGAGGAGGYRTNVSGAKTGGNGPAETLYNDFQITTTFVSVGAGGLRNNHVQATSVNDGEKSIFGPVISDGGGGGGHYIGNQNNTGNPGGSGGGSNYSNAFAPAILTYDGLPQGCDGGNDSNSGGPGGGAGAPGYQGSTNNEGHPGGAGLPSSITGTEIWRGGGGGSAVYTGGSGIGGQGGGGDGSEGGVSSPGEPNTGGGGGSSSKNGQGADGGSGVVILAYPKENSKLPYIDGNLAYKYSQRPSDQAHVYEFVRGTGVISATDPNPAFYSKELENACLFNGNGNNDNVADTLISSKTVNYSSYTFSMWFKRGIVNSPSSQYMVSSDTPNKGMNIGGLSRPSGQDNMLVYYDGSGDTYGISKVMDSAAWYHLLITWNNSQLKIYLNTRLEITSGIGLWADNSTPILGAWIGGDDRANYGYNGYMSNVQLVDGQALAPDSFATYREGVLIPKEYTGEYGANGFHLDFSDADDLGKDVSGKNNHWT